MMGRHERRLEKLEGERTPGSGMLPVELVLLGHDDPPAPDRPGVNLIQVRFIDPEKTIARH